VEQAGRSAVAHPINRNARLGASVLNRGDWYYPPAKPQPVLARAKEACLPSPNRKSATDVCAEAPQSLMLERCLRAKIGPRGYRRVLRRRSRSGATYPIAGHDPATKPVTSRNG
jgi:hypothetical protein